MTESSDADLITGVSARRRVIVGVAAALAGLAVGSDAYGHTSPHSSQTAPNVATDSARTSLLQDLALRTCSAPVHVLQSRSTD
jgi:hypothetical protein